MNELKKELRVWNKKIIITKHVRERFEERNIKFTNNKPRSIESQIKHDLRPLNIRKQEKLLVSFLNDVHSI